MAGISTWLASVVAAAIVTVLINDPLKYLLASLVGGLSLGRRSFRGIWKGSYDYPSDGLAKNEEHYFIVRQIGRYLVARTIFKGAAYYRLKGKLDGKRFFTGHWDERTPDGRYYHGAFQLAIRPQGKKMTGMWIGYNRHDKVMTGSWNWILEMPKPPREEVAKLRNISGWPSAEEEGARFE